MGQTAEQRRLGCRPAAPAVLGVEGVGRIRAVGPGVQGTSVGDRVVAHGAPLPGGRGFWAEQVLVTAAHTAPVPNELEHAAAAALPVNGLTA
ncbi:alcohol dehydrogenase catalytic domain-containing protein [Streptomyces sp. KR55]|uniref:alcohol dehydrogenase catalytic domain-containing protein n=1 Tax=Streptomyces sp. KR55 TaxID=3457425 RepID=UPI003FD06710